MADNAYISDKHFYRDLPLTDKVGDPIPILLIKKITD